MIELADHNKNETIPKLTTYVQRIQNISYFIDSIREQLSLQYVMCIILSGEQPKRTLLVSLPVTRNGQKCHMLIYVNHLEKSERSQHTDSVMVVPIPFSSAEQSVEDISFVDLETCRPFIRKLRTLSDRIIKDKAIVHSGLQSRCFSNAAPAPIIQVGAYACSFVKDRAQLTTNLFYNPEWRACFKNLDLALLDGVIGNKALYPHPMGLMVARATQPVKEAGFAVIYPDVGFDYFPLAHEFKINNEHDYDVCCFHFSNRRFSLKQKFSCLGYGYKDLSKSGQWTLVPSNKSNCAAALEADDAMTFLELMPTVSVSAFSGQKRFHVVNASLVRHVSFLPLKCNSINQNVYV